MLREELLSINKFPFDSEHIILKRSNVKEEGEVLIFQYDAQNDSEFDVYVEFYSKTYNLYCEGWHDFFEYEDLLGDSPVTLIKEQLISLINGDTKLKVNFSGNTPFKWELIHFNEDDNQKSLGSVGLIFYNYFGKKSQVIKMNNLLV